MRIFKKYLPLLLTVLLSGLAVSYAVNHRLSNTDYQSDKLSVYKTLERAGLSWTENEAVLQADGAPSYANTHEAFLSVIAAQNPQKQLDVNQLMRLYAALLVPVLGLLSFGTLRTDRPWTNYLCAALLVAVFCDAYYTGSLCSIGPQPLTLLLFLLTCGLFLVCYQQNRAPVWLLAALYASGSLYGFTGTLQGLTGILFGLLLLRLYRLAQTRPAKIVSVVLGCALALQCGVFAAAYRDAHREDHLFNAVFQGVCMYDSVTELGLDPELDELKDQWYSKELAEQYQLHDRFYSRISGADIAGYYLTHPLSAFDLMGRAASEAFRFVPERGMRAYSLCKEGLMNGLLVSFWLLFAVYSALLVWLYKDRPHLRDILGFFIALQLMLLLALAYPGFSNGVSALREQLYLFNILFDGAVITVIVGGSRLKIRRKNGKDC